jgi:biopolymer transport protein ExbB
MQIERLLRALTDLGAGWVLWLLAALSVLGLAVIVERALYLFSTRDDTARLRRELRAELGRNNPGRARDKLAESPSFEARIAGAALEASTSGAAEQKMAGAKEIARLRMERRLAILGTLGNNAPFIGLLGTVIGIVRAFRELESGAGQISAGLMSEIGEALIATAVGILVALPAVAAFNAFQRVIRSRMARGEALSREVLAWLEQGSA